MHIITTERLEHTFRSAKGWRREFTIGEFLPYSDIVDLIMTNIAVLQVWLNYNKIKWLKYIDCIQKNYYVCRLFEGNNYEHLFY